MVLHSLRNRRFLYAKCMPTICESSYSPNVFAVGFAGYCARASASKKTGKIMPFASQNVFILLGPTLFAASIYMCLSRTIRGIQASHLSPIEPRILTRTFVIGDVVSFVVQGGATGMMVTGKNAKLGEGIGIAGLLIQSSCLDYSLPPLLYFENV
jgi:hypothetical protein